MLGQNIRVGGSGGGGPGGGSGSLTAPVINMAGAEPAVGETLTVTPGVTATEDGSDAYAWYWADDVDAKSISNNPNYVVGVPDTGHTLCVVQINTLGDVISTARSAVTLPTINAYEPETSTFLMALDVLPTDAVAVIIDDLIVGLKGAGIYAKLDILGLHNIHNADDCLRNFKNPSYEAVLSGAAAFTAGEGIAPTNNSGATAKLINWGPRSTWGSNYTSDSAMNAVYSNSNAWNHANSNYWGFSTGQTHVNWNTAGQFDLRSHSGAQANPQSYSNANPMKGLWINNRRPTNTAQLMFKKATLLNVGSYASAGIPGGDFTIFNSGGASTYGSFMCAVSLAGSGLTDGERDALSDLLDTYCTAMAAAL